MIMFSHLLSPCVCVCAGRGGRERDVSRGGGIMTCIHLAFTFVPACVERVTALMLRIGRANSCHAPVLEVCVRRKASNVLPPTLFEPDAEENGKTTSQGMRGEEEKKHRKKTR